MNFKELLDSLDNEKREINKAEVMKAYTNLLRAIKENDLVDVSNSTNQHV